MHPDIPLLDYDDTIPALIEPADIIKKIDIPEHCVLCFFQDEIQKLVSAGRARKITAQKSEMGKHVVFQIEFEGQPVVLFHPGISAPFAAAMLEELIARGCRKFIACGGAGTLDSRIAQGHLIVPDRALRDEGTSYHYLPPAREVAADAAAVTAIREVLQQHQIPFIIGKTWTTDGFYRETPERIRKRKQENCLTVEMEAAALFAVAQFRKVTLGQILYAGDDVGGEKWDSRMWTKNASVREKLIWLAAEACLRL